MLKKFWYLFLVLLVEGASLMAVELMGAKLLAPFYGSSLYVWTAVLCITVLGLTLGYYSGGKLSAKYASEKILIIILCCAAMLVFALPLAATLLISITSGMGLITGICTASFLLLAPPMFCFGLVGPMVVRLMAQKMETLGNVAGTVYFTSTIGGIIATFLFGFYWIPELGLKLSSLIICITLVFLPIIYFIKSIPLINAKSTSQTDEVVQPGVHIAESGTEPTRPAQAGRQKLKTKNKKLRIHSSIYFFAALEGATVMCVELISARMLAPYFGSSLFVWVAVIGITLLSLALGYYTGGRLADKYTRIATIHWVLLIASVFLMFMHYISQHLTMVFMGMEMRLAAVLVSLLLILPPLLFMGMVPTLLIRFLTANVDHSGAITGRVFTISSASGIIILPLMGFFIIQQFGLTTPSIIIGLLVGIIPLLKLLVHNKFISFIYILFILFSFSQRKIATSSPDVRVIAYSEGLLGQVLVADVFKNGAGEKTNDRLLFINRMGQTGIDLNSNTTKWNYITFFTSVASKLPEHSRALLLGLGGGAGANVLKNNLQFAVDAVELDERIVNIARKYFFLNPDIHVIIDDARHYLEKTTQTYDLIFFDVFRGEFQPPHVLSLECLKKARSLLNKNGLILINFNGFLSGEIGKPGRSVYVTLQAAGLYTKILTTPGKVEERNTLFVASAEPQDFHQVRSPLLHSGKPVDIDSLFIDANALNLKDAVVFTDDRSSLDRLNLKANNSWRKGYNGTYTKFFLDNGVPLFN
ncbi:MAG: fused MFS/spermidine synthase [Bacteroidia bacterium]|nr:fused MFS/spermidine synthase [Bacteroidia bacterium]